MADLFLDTAYLEIVGADRVADRVREAGFTPGELRNIFRNEVGPAFSFNLLQIAGEWIGWDLQFVQERVLLMMSTPGTRFSGRIQYWLVGRCIYRDWLKVEAGL